MATYDSLLTGSNTTTAAVRSAGDAASVSLPAAQTIDTTTLVATDFQRLWPVPNGSILLELALVVQDADTDGSPTLDMDIILRDDDGDTVLLNAGTAFQSAYDDLLQLQRQYVNAKNTGIGYVGFEVVTAAATGVAAATVDGTLRYH